MLKLILAAALLIPTVKGCGSASAPLAPALPVPGTTGNCSGAATAQAAQFTKLAFCDDFDSAATIDSQATGKPGFKWYVHRLADTALPSEYVVAASALVLADAAQDYNWGLATTDIKTGAGQSWTFGYFEARVAFDPAQSTLGPGWPSFWAESTAEAETRSRPDFAELDFFEASPQTSPGPYLGAFGATLHDWRPDAATSGGFDDFMDPRNLFPSGVDWTQWHTIGCAWTRGLVIWYLDGREINRQAYSPTTQGSPAAKQRNGILPVPAGVFTVLDSERMMLLLGSGPKWPMRVDWVRVWQ